MVKGRRVFGLYSICFLSYGQRLTIGLLCLAILSLPLIEVSQAMIGMGGEMMVVSPQLLAKRNRIRYKRFCSGKLSLLDRETTQILSACRHIGTIDPGQNCLTCHPHAHSNGPY